MKTKTIITAILMSGMVVGAATFESIPFNTPTYSDDDPLGVGILTNTANKVVEVEVTASNAVEAAATAQATADSA